MVSKGKDLVSLRAVVGLTLLVALLAAGPALAQFSQMQFASGAVTSGPTGGWVGSGNATGPSDSNCAAANSTPGGNSIEFTFPAFSIPAGNIIKGVEVKLDYETAGENDVQLHRLGTLIGVVGTMPAAPGPSTCDGTSWTTAGSPTDLWGASLTITDFNDGDIGFRMTQPIVPIAGGDPGSLPVDIDAAELVVYYGPANSPPTAEANGPYPVNEGGSVALSSAGSSDPDGDPLTIAWDLDNDGTFETPGASPVFSAAGFDGPASQPIAVQVSDGIAPPVTDTATVNILNAPPTITGITLSATSIDEGQGVNVSGTFTDPALGLPTETFSGTAVWSDGLPTPLTVGAGTFSTSRSFADDDPTGTASDPFTVQITISDDDGGSDSAASPVLTVNNVAPTVDPPTVDIEPSDEGQQVVASADFSDPGVNDTFTCTVDYGEGGGPEAGTVGGTTCDGPPHSYGDDGDYTVTVCVTDDDTGQGCESSTHTVLNVPPTVDPPAVDIEPSDEGADVVASADFTDPGTDDSPFSCTVDYGFGLGPQTGTIAGMTCTGPAESYGDDGTYTVTICVKDKDDGEGCESSDHVVDNVAPEVQLDTGGATTFPSGDDAFTGRQGEEQSHSADAQDPGSDDLTFAWDFGFAGPVTTYYNDTGDPSGTPDPFPSPGGDYPFSASDTASVTFADPGVYLVRVDVTDDDGGGAFDELPKLVAGAGDCAYSQGFWRHQFRGRGKPHFDVTTLQAYLDLVGFASGVFSEEVAASIPAEAQAVFSPGGSFYDKAVRQTLAAWLNWASGGVAWDEGIDLDGDMAPDMEFSVLIAMVEAILLDPDSDHADLEMAKDLAEAVNLLDEDSLCEPRVATRPITVDR